MSPETKKTLTYFFYALYVAALLAAGISSLVLHVHQIKAETESVFAHRSEILKRFVARHRDHVTAMRSLMLERYESMTPDEKTAFTFRRPTGQKAWELNSDALHIDGSVTGVGPLPLSEKIRREIRSALAMNAQIHSRHIDEEENLWSYYLSANGFIFITPRISFEKFHFKPELYGKRNWIEAIPATNSERRIILAGPYEDEAGGGWVVSIAAPVYAGERFLGMVGEDMHVATLEKLTNIGAVTGESMLIGENDRVMARQNGFKPHARIRPPLADKLTDWREDSTGDLWLSSAIVKDELWLVHRVKLSELYWAAAKESAGLWLMLLLFALVVFLMIRYARAVRELREVNALKDRFLGIAAHDLRSPLTALRGLSEMMLEMELDASQGKEFLLEINKTSDDMLRLVNDLLDVAVIESGKLDIRLRPGDFGKLVQSRIRLLLPSAQKKGISVTVDTPGTLSGVFDSDRCSQVVDNILSNAIKFTPPNTNVHVRAFEEGGSIVFAVRDEGPGVAAEDREKLFGTFQKLKARPTAGEKSTGLGLAIVKKIVDAHHGSIDVINLPAGGAEFSVRLPKEHAA